MVEKYMRRAIELALRGTGFTNPNPLVGAVIVKDGKIIGEGFHERYGHEHAERNALKSCTEDPSGADMYVTLEPCCHHGKQPPCTDAVIAAGIKRVFVGSSDPNPLVSGGGVKLLRDAGVEVTEGVLKDECDGINKIFFHYITTKTPYVILKLAETADGRIAAADGSSRWVTNEKSREKGHLLRKRCAAIMTGIGTVLADDPMLNCRAENPSNPVRIICDSRLRIPLESKIIKSAREIPVYIACAGSYPERERAIEAAGAHIIKTESDNGRVKLSELMKKLGETGIDSVLCEGGAGIAAALLKNGLVDGLACFIAPKLLGGEGRAAVDALGIESISDAIRLSSPEIEILDGDIYAKYEVI